MCVLHARVCEIIHVLRNSEMNPYATVISVHAFINTTISLQTKSIMHYALTLYIDYVYLVLSNHVLSGLPHPLSATNCLLELVRRFVTSTEHHVFAL